MTLTLAFDTSGPWCAAALLRGDAVLATRAEEMAKGQAERLMPLLEDLLAEHGYAWADLDRIGVGTGPGNFTGIRIAVSAARGLALALNIPAVGVSTFDAIHHDAPEALAGVPAPRDHLYVRAPGGAPAYIREAEAPGAPMLPPAPAALVTAMARVAAAAPNGPPPAPLYIKPADAAPSRDAPPVRLG
ncbi:tRNA (adenosine(37)-N6)-threonylcarbamoyltransferase complex dimerization subunit type 1 TsaB [Thalassococcus sp. BH17M4-6]|uniref:tRNA (adenosine(37)-N6)-threonylcarbamoyltransferase complex dimerization subunit type 1 TsaB n=1 Tax=Thalassococcus sp. BH17M4-6 TaxID=3413148 RepID=UPI003BC85B20